MTTNNAINEKTAASGKVLQGQGVGVTSDFSTATYPSTATGTGTLLRADGTNWVATTSTYPNTNAVNTLLYASSANVMSALPTANTAVLATNGSGVPSITATPAVTSITLSGGTALSAYVEGTWTPGISGSTGAPTLTYSVQRGSYTRIGNRCVLDYLVNINTYTGGSGTGDLQITGLPFTVNSNNQFPNGSCSVGNITFSGNYLETQANTNSTVLLFVRSTTAAPAVNIAVNSSIASSAQVSGQITFQI